MEYIFVYWIVKNGGENRNYSEKKVERGCSVGVGGKRLAFPQWEMNGGRKKLSLP
jgi:hypothetical protein